VIQMVIKSGSKEVDQNIIILYSNVML